MQNIDNFAVKNPFVMLLAAPEGQSWKVGTVFWGSF
jgi:hypothetical protein